VKLTQGFHYAEGTFLWVINNIFFQYYSLLIFLVSASVMIVVSYMSEAPAVEKISGLTYGTVTDEHRRESRASWDARDVVLSVLVLALILAAYLYFVG
jgi:SSS family solute:Na+ symporter